MVTCQSNSESTVKFNLTFKIEQQFDAAVNTSEVAIQNIDHAMVNCKQQYQTRRQQINHAWFRTLGATWWLDMAKGSSEKISLPHPHVQLPGLRGGVQYDLHVLLATCLHVGSVGPPRVTGLWSFSQNKQMNSFLAPSEKLLAERLCGLSFWGSGVAIGT